MRIAVAIELTDVERVTLKKWSRGRSTPARLVIRAKMILLASEGWLNKDIARKLGAIRWRLAKSIRRKAARWNPSGRATKWPQTNDHAESRQQDSQEDNAGETSWPNTLEHANNGRGHRRESIHSQPHLA